ncbi:MAG: tRNA (adenosine(37)-N6)-threonylcarbamoyltransferase complex transferase subunit TsaD [Deferribacteraceae bacterium]|jgi:N6-L-threonylcarbamoyladenine synthase|nr:tRNA (adenosine(37)-N6)-threonylcarbamoyltransferase complex transferase subunit TsaD [Deferribacteraceae bacterium]
MLILGIETSCDETSLAILRDNHILASETFSQGDIHAVFGGVVPEVASRNHLAKIVPLFSKIIDASGISPDKLDLIAVTNAPGLIGALFVGVSFAKGLAFALKKPLVPVHHLAGHILSAELSNQGLIPPYAAIVASGGHTHIYDVCSEPLCFKLWGRTIDDAAGEAFDKVAKMLGGTYPGGPFVESLALTGSPSSIKFPVALKKSENFSFSGLKTSVMNKINEGIFSYADIAASFQYTVAITMTDKILRAAKELNRKTIVVSGGVSCNKAIRAVFTEETAKEGIDVYFPAPALSTDNGAMIAYTAWRIFKDADMSNYMDLTFSAGDTRHEIDA